MSETLTERVADMRSGQTSEDAEIEEIAHSVSVIDNQVFVETLKDEKYQFGSIRSMAIRGIDEHIESFQESEDVRISSDTRDTIQNIILSVKQAWDPEIEMFRLDYNTNNKGQISEFYIPFDSDLIDNPTAFRMYDESGDFVAHDVEEDIGDQIGKIETTDLYVNSIPADEERVSVYTKTRPKGLDLYRDKLSSVTKYDNNREAAADWFRSLMVGFFIMVPHAILGSADLFMFTFLLLIVPDLLKMIPKIATIPILVVYSMICAKKRKGVARRKKFFTTN